MDYETNGKVNAIKTEVHDEEYDEYDSEEEMNYENEAIEREEEVSNSSNNKNNDVKKKLIKLMIIIALGMVVLFILLGIASKLNNKKYTYEDVEKVMGDAAKAYFTENPKNLPQEDTQTVEIEVATLIAKELMKPLEEYLGEEHGCTGKVQVRKTPSDYTYTPYLMCGEKYSTKFLSDTVTDEKNLVGSSYGLYLMNDSYVFRGEEVNNYVKLDAKLWRIVKVNSDKTIQLILAEPMNYMYEFDDRYNQSADREFGINAFQTSRVKEYLETMFNTTDDADRYNYILSENDKSKLVKYDICVNKVANNNTIHDNSLECSQTIQGYIGLLTVSDYMNASIDTGCNAVTSSSCQNYNYLGANGSFWLGTPSATNTYTSYVVNAGVIFERNSNDRNGVKPVITLSRSTLISEGDGSYENPYIIK